MQCQFREVQNLILAFFLLVYTVYNFSGSCKPELLGSWAAGVNCFYLSNMLISLTALRSVLAVSALLCIPLILQWTLLQHQMVHAIRASDYSSSGCKACMTSLNARISWSRAFYEQLTLGVCGWVAPLQGIAFISMDCSFSKNFCFFCFEVSLSPFFGPKNFSMTRVPQRYLNRQEVRCDLS